VTEIDWQSIQQALQQSTSELQALSSGSPAFYSTLLAQRAQNLAQRQLQTDQEEAAVTYLHVSVGGEAYGLAAEHLLEIRPFAACQPLAMSPPELLGICYLHGNMVSVLDLAPLLQVPEPSDLPGQILFLRHALLGLRVTQVHDLLLLSSHQIQALEPAPQSYVQALGPQQLQLLDLPRLLQAPIFLSSHAIAPHFTSKELP